MVKRRKKNIRKDGGSKRFNKVHAILKSVDVMGGMTTQVGCGIPYYSVRITG